MSDSLWPMDCSPPGSCIHGVLQARILKWVAIPFSRGSSQPRDWTRVSSITGRFLTIWDTKKAYGGEVAQSCLTLCNPVDCNLLGFSVHGILQARMLEWVAISLSRGSSRPRDRAQVSRIGGRCFNLWATREAPPSDSIKCTLMKEWINCNGHKVECNTAAKINWRHKQQHGFFCCC